MPARPPHADNDDDYFGFVIGGALVAIYYLGRLIISLSYFAIFVPTRPPCAVTDDDYIYFEIGRAFVNYL